MKTILWILVNCNTAREADRIGRAVLERRLVSCYDILPRLKAAYFWPPRSKNIETAKGAMLVLETLPRHFSRTATVVKKLHSDTLPFIGSLSIGHVSDAYYRWIQGELQTSPQPSPSRRGRILPSPFRRRLASGPTGR